MVGDANRAFRVLRYSRCAFLLMIACGGRQDSLQTSATATSVARDTVRIMTTGDGQWGAPYRVEEVLRVRMDAPVSAFGTVRDVFARADGGVVVFDEAGPQGPVIYSFDSLGVFEHRFGRSGGGPGEFSANFVRIAVQREGAILVHEAPRMIHRFSASGTLLGNFRIESRGSRAAIYLGEHGSFFTSARLVQPSVKTRSISSFGRASVAEGDLRLQKLFHYDSAGVLLDSIVFNRYWLKSDEPFFSKAPSQWWFPLPDGTLVISRTDKLGVLIEDIVRSRTPIVTEVPVVPVPFLDAEREENERGRPGDRSHYVAPTTTGDDSDYKLPAGLSDPDIDGRIWLRKNVKSERVEPFCISVEEGVCRVTRTYQDPNVYLAFQPDGTFLGEVRFPLGVNMVRFHGDFAWAVRKDENDEQIVVKYRIRK